VHPNIFLDAARVQVDKVIDKKPVHKPSLEFKQAVIRYIKNTDLHYFQHVQRSSDENVAYKKELRYLFKNYGTLSAITLLSRLRSAHQTMVRQDTNTESETYLQYEQICSALLLTVSQVFYNEMRNQILHALHDIDNLLVYWYYQHNHQIYYFFHKSPTKWVMGKKQEKEIAHNIVKLERKQRELYTLLGSLTEHVHSFAAIETTYEHCYAWIEQLFEITSDLKISSQYSTDESRFDELAAILALKLKRVTTFKTDSLASVAAAKKPNRLIRNWILYSTVVASLAYMAHYNAKNPQVIPSALNAVQDEASKFLILLLHPLQKIYGRGKLAFSTEKKIEEKTAEDNALNELSKKLGEEIASKMVKDIEKKNTPQKDAEDKPSVSSQDDLDDLLNETIKVGEETISDIAEQLAKSNSSVREDGFKYIQQALDTYPHSAMVINFKKSGDLDKIKKLVEPIKVNGIVINQKEVDEYKESFKKVTEFVDQFSQDSWWITSGNRSSWVYLNFGLGLIRADDDYLNLLQKYTDIIDKKILRLFQLSALVVDNLGRKGDSLIAQADDLIAQANRLERDADKVLKYVEAELKYVKEQLRDHELTLMFTSLIPLGITALAGTKAYKWATTRDYSSIRIALSDVNALLIEAAHNLDDYQYGKLVYLICKLRHKAIYLKDSLANEFLDDVAKLESKQYSAQTKHGIVENMFNKYAFLGKIAI
jgi:hypothetical protein